jgi:hypothetical protein
LRASTLVGVDESGVPSNEGQGGDGVIAVLHGMLASFSEALDGFDHRLAAIEVALRAGPGETTERLAAIEARAAALQRTLDELRVTLQAHADETSHSLGRRAGEAGRLLAADLVLWGRPRPSGGPPPAGG